MSLACLTLELIALVGGTVHTLEPDARPALATVLVEGHGIRAIGPELALPEGARVVDCTGLHLVPGLIDGWAHLDPDHDALWVAHGVTLVRDAGNDLGRILVERQAEARERTPGPDVLVCGSVLDGAPPSTTAAIVLASPEEVEPKLTRLAELEVDFLATHVGLSEPVWKAVLGFAHAHELDLWGPRPRALTLEAALAPRPTGLVAIDALLPEGERWDSVGTDALRAPLESFAASGAALVPLLAVHGVRVVAPTPDAPELRWLGPLYRALWQADFAQRQAAYQSDPKAYVQAGLAAVRTQGELLAALRRRGVRLVPGSGAPHPWLLPGRALIDELSLWKRAGLEPGEVLRAATVDAARALGVLEQRGTLAPGKLADLVAYARDPEQDLGALKQPALVVLRGRVLARAELDAMLERLAAEQERRRQEAAQPIEVAAPELPDGELLLDGQVETWAGAERVAAERFAVVREADGTLAYVGRARRLGSATVEGSELAIEQHVLRGRLSAFRVRVESGERTLEVVGQTAGGRLAVERRVDGAFVDNVPVEESLALVDSGSVTGALILGHEVEPGLFRALFFEDADPAIASYELRLDPEHSLLLRGPTGDRILRFDERGFPVQILEQRGSAVLSTRAVEVDTHGGAGLPLPMHKRPQAAAQPASAPVEGARAPAPKEGAPR